MEHEYILKYIRTADERNELINLIEELIENNFKKTPDPIDSSPFSQKPTPPRHLCTGNLPKTSGVLCGEHTRPVCGRTAIPTPSSRRRVGHYREGNTKADLECRSRSARRNYLLSGTKFQPDIMRL